MTTEKKSDEKTTEPTVITKEDFIKALLELYNNRQKLVILSNNAIKMIRFFSYDKVAEKFIMNLEEL